MRGWFVRKNYINLREAARVIQVAFREKKRALQLKGLSLKRAADDNDDNENDDNNGYNDDNKDIKSFPLGGGLTTSITTTTSSNIMLSLKPVSSLDEVELTYSNDDYDDDEYDVNKRTLHNRNNIYNYNNDNTTTKSTIIVNTTNTLIPTMINIKKEEEEVVDEEIKLQAAATLQALTRGMIARKSFNSIRKHTTASIIIQKTLVKWWIQKNNLNNNQISSVNNRSYRDHHDDYHDNHHGV